MARQVEAASGEIVVFSDEAGEEYSAPEVELLESLKEADATAEVILYRQNTKNHKEGMHQIESWSGDAVNMTMIREAAKGHIPDPYKDTYFRINVRKAGRLVAGGNKCFSISAKTRPADAPTPLPALSGEVGTVLQGVMQMQREMLAEIRQAQSRQPDPMAQMGTMFVLMKQMREAMGMPSTSAVTAPAAPIDPVKMLIDSLAGLRTLREAAGDLMGLEAGPKENDGIVGVIERIAPQAMGLLKRHQDIEAAKVMKAGGRLPNPAPRLKPPSAAPVPTAVETDALPPEARSLLEQLQEWAAQDADVEGIAEGMVKEPKVRPVLDMMRAQTGDGSMFRVLVSYWPAALDYPQWWGDLLDAVDERLTTGTESAENAASTVPTGAPDVQLAANNDGANS